ncbi:MAG TPA: aminoglycoside phosphotransferase family protein [Blastocatellia bacterium]|nr:aminoglycoside phosphotransferase family protein [Blastocatellia bacterium]
MERVGELARKWGVVVERTVETPGSIIAFGARGHVPVVLKVIRKRGDEWQCGEALDAFQGVGTVRTYERVEGAVLLERLDPGTPLVEMVLDGRDEEAADIVAEIVQKMAHPQASSHAFATVEDWGKGFDRYLASDDNRIPLNLVERGQQLYFDLSSTQQSTGLLHGDLQHYNILFDSRRGWLAIDPKGVIGEIEYEMGASLRNPYEKPESFTSTRAIERRVRRYEEKLKIDGSRVMLWAFSQAILSAIWSVEDGDEIDVRNPALMLARTILPMLNGT